MTTQILRSAIAALAFAAMACGGGDPPGGGSDETDGGGSPGDGPTGSCQWDEDFPDNPGDPMMDPDCNPLIPIINHDDDDHRWRDVRRDDGIHLYTGFGVYAAVNDPACVYTYGAERIEIRHATGDACVTIRNDVNPPIVLAGDRLSIDVTWEYMGQRYVFVAEGQVLDNGTRMRYTILEFNGPINWTFEIERLPPP